MAEPSLNRPCTHDTLETLQIPYQGQTLTLIPCTNPKTNISEIRFSLSDNTLFVLTLESEDRKRKDWQYYMREYPDGVIRETTSSDPKFIFGDHGQMLNALERILAMRQEQNLTIIPDGKYAVLT